MDQDRELAQEFSFWSLMVFVVPSIFAFVFIGLYQMVDGLFIEQFVGEMAISAISLYYPVISLFIAVGIMIGTGGNAEIVRKVGEGKRREAGLIFSRVVSFTTLLGLVFTAVCLLFADPIMRLCGATEGNIEYLRPYYVIMSAFSIMILLQSELGIFIIGEGRTATAAFVIMGGGVLNCVLDYLFMAKLHMGIRGAAIATVIGYSSTIAYAVWFYVIRRKSGYRLEPAWPRWREMMQICYNGSSDMVSNLAQGVTVLFMNHLAYRCYGVNGVSALTVVIYVQTLIMLAFMGFTSAVEPVFSYHYGSGNAVMLRRVYRLCMLWCAVLGAAIMLLLFLLRRQVIDMFFDRGTLFYGIAEQGYLISLPACLFVGFNIFGSGLFTAFSNGLVSGLLSLVRTFVVLTACLFGLTALFGGTGLWSAWPAAELACLVITLAVLKRYRNVYHY